MVTSPLSLSVGEAALASRTAVPWFEARAPLIECGVFITSHKFLGSSDPLSADSGLGSVGKGASSKLTIIARHSLNDTDSGSGLRRHVHDVVNNECSNVGLPIVALIGLLIILLIIF